MMCIQYTIFFIKRKANQRTFTRALTLTGEAL